MTTNPKEDEREKLENDLLPIVGMLPFLERGHTMGSHHFTKLTDYILANYTPRAEATATQERAVAEAKKVLLERLIKLPNIYPEIINGEYTHVEAIYKSALTNELKNIKQLAAPQNRGEG